MNLSARRGDRFAKAAGERDQQRAAKEVIMSTLVKAVLATSVISAASIFNPKLKAEPYCCRHPAVCDAICSASCCEKKRVSSLLVPVLSQASSVS
jgi:hypothetical protein